METQLRVEILPQPDDTTCGPTCLHALYRFYGDHLPLEQVIAEVRSFDEGGTLAVYLGCHALARGYRAVIYTYNLHIWDPTWFQSPAPALAERLRAQAAAKPLAKLEDASAGYLEFLERGGEIRYEDLTTGLVRKFLNRSIPILTGLSATYLYRSAREYGAPAVADSIRGEPVGHFVVLCGYDRDGRQVLVADPMHPNPLSGGNQYWMSIDRVLGAVLLGILTYDANLLVIEPLAPRKPPRHVHPDRR